jgi:hypothetical protein
MWFTEKYRLSNNCGLFSLKRSYGLLFFCFILSKGIISLSFSQNFVSNGNFETHTSCPNYQGQWYYAIPWDTVPGNGSSPDYFNSCSPTNSNPNGMGTPKNVAGFQYPLNGGNSYMGIYCYVKNNANSREYILNKLLCPLQNGKTYKAGFFLNKSNWSRYAIDQMGMYIGDTIHGNGPPHVLNAYIPQIKNSTGVFLKDTVNWMEISGTFTAQGNEKYIAIGNFATDANTMVKDSVGPLGNNGTYYYIDSVYVIPTSPQITISNDTAICKGSSATLQAGGSSVYYWFNSANMLDTLGTNNVLTVSPTITTTYVLHTCCNTTYPVHVQVAINPPVSFSLGKDTLLCAHDTLMLTAPSGYTYQWQDGNSHSAITVTQAGIYWVDVSNACGTTSDTINASYSDCTGVQDIFSNGGMLIYPNPAKKEINIEVTDGKYVARIKNSLGQEIFQQQFTKQLKIDSSQFPKGLYLVEVCIAEGKSCHTEKIIIQ